MRLVPETSALSPELRGQYPAAMVTDNFALFKMLCLLLLMLLAGCQAIAGTDSLATIEANMTALAAERESIHASATADANRVAGTVVAAGTRVAQLSRVNAALAATLRANYTATPALQAVVVNAADMGNSREDDMLAAAPGSEAPLAMQVSALATATATNPNSGCAVSTQSQFSPAAQRIYLTAQVSNLRAGSEFSALWRYEGQEVSSHSWRAERSEDFLCIWFYVTPADFAFQPGNYTALLYVDGALAGNVPFIITA